MYYSHDMKPLKLGERKLKEKKKRNLWHSVNKNEDTNGSSRNVPDLLSYLRCLSVIEHKCDFLKLIFLLVILNINFSLWEFSSITSRKLYTLVVAYVEAHLAISFSKMSRLNSNRVQHFD